MKVLMIMVLLITSLFSWSSKGGGYNYNRFISRYGVEFNPFRLIVMSSSWKSISGSLSIFDYVNNSEISFPLLYSHEDDFKLLTIDAHYRKFINNRVNGLYVSLVGRVASLEGKLRSSRINSSGENYAKVTKLGVGLGIGYRFLPKLSKWYWGVGLVAGRYLGSDNDIFDSGTLSAIDDAPIFLDIELLKIGYKF